MNVLEISECFPNNFKPVTGEFILQHVRSLAKHCNVLTVVPLKIVPPKELLSLNPIKLISNIYRWFTLLKQTKDFSEGNLQVIYFRYISLPRQYSGTNDKRFINYFFLKKIKKIVSAFKPDIIYCNWIRPWAQLSGMVAKDLNIPFVIDHHEDLPTLKKIFPGDYPDSLNVFEDADKIIVHSSLNKQELLEENLKLQEIKTIYLGQNFSVPEKIKDFNFDKVRLACVSHLSEERKNIDDLIRALGIIKHKLNFNLEIAGDGMLKTKYIRLCKELDMEYEVKFHGEKNQNEVEEILDESHIFILPSYPEAFGIVLIEALAKGVPVITCKGSGGGEELKQLGYPAILVKPHSPEAIANAIMNLTNNKNKLSLMSESGKDIVRKHFSREINAKNTYDFLSRIVH
ncbi:MAG: glycosyltransferase family 4 protein [Bacteroidota bacterium]|nr:glycosyltransferase family 4 protein [Bacteroidota bacterium]